MVARTNLAVGARRMLDLAGSLVAYAELRIAPQVSAAENGGMYHILMGTAYADDIPGAPVPGSVLSSVNSGIQVFTEYIMSIY